LEEDIIKNRTSRLNKKKFSLIFFRFDIKKRAPILTTIFLLLILSFIVYTKLQLLSLAKGTDKVLPSEFEKQQAMWMMWPCESCTLNNPHVNRDLTNVIKSLSPYIKINILADSNFEISQIKAAMTKYNCPNSNYKFYIVNHHCIWARDVGPIFIRDNRGKLGVVNFGFDNYGRNDDGYYISTEGQVDEQIAKFLRLPIMNSTLISEGGSIESNGRGTIMLTESVTLKRNPGLTKKQIENEYKRVLGVKKIIWLNNGLAEDEVTGGHIDEFARFANTNTILLAKVLQGDRYANWASKSSYLNLEENYKILINATDQDGKPFNIIRVPMPPTLYQEVGEAHKIPVRSYLNYVTTDGAVLVQTYWKPGRSNILKISDEQVKHTLKTLFPGRKVIGINAENINLQGGGIHCVTQHMPASK
jgi:agmatine deiminase